MSSHRIDRRTWCQGVLAFTGLAAAGVSAEQQKPAVLHPRLDDPSWRDDGRSRSS